MSARLSGLTIGALTLTPTFDEDTLEYTVTTTAATNKITATAEDENATVVIKNGTTTVENEGSASWSAGENTLTVTVSNGEYNTKVYTVTVTKS